MARGIMPYIDGLIRRTTTLKEAFRDMLADMAVRLAQSGLSRIFGSIAGSFFGGDALAGALQGAGLNAIPALADGGRIVRSGIFQINEAGGEARRLESGDVVFPHSLSREMARGVTGGGQPLALRLQLSDDLEARIVQGASAVADVKIEGFSQSELPAHVSALTQYERERM